MLACVYVQELIWFLEELDVIYTGVSTHEFSSWGIFHAVGSSLSYSGLIGWRERSSYSDFVCPRAMFRIRVPPRPWIGRSLLFYSTPRQQWYYTTHSILYYHSICCMLKWDGQEVVRLRRVFLIAPTIVAWSLARHTWYAINLDSQSSNLWPWIYYLFVLVSRIFIVLLKQDKSNSCPYRPKL